MALDINQLQNVHTCAYIRRNCAVFTFLHSIMLYDHIFRRQSHLLVTRREEMAPKIHSRTSCACAEQRPSFHYIVFCLTLFASCRPPGPRLLFRRHKTNSPCLIQLLYLNHVSSCALGTNSSRPSRTAWQASAATSAHLTYHWGFTSGSIMSFEREQKPRRMGLSATPRNRPWRGRNAERWSDQDSERLIEWVTHSPTYPPTHSLARSLTHSPSPPAASPPPLARQTSSCPQTALHLR